MSDSHTAGRPDQLEETLRYMGLRTKHAESDCRITAAAGSSSTLDLLSSPQANSSVHIFLCHQCLGVRGGHDIPSAFLRHFLAEDPGLLQCIRRAAVIALGLCRM